MKLTDVFLRGLKTTGKVQKFSDGGGLYLCLSLSGAKLWRMAYRFEGRQKTLSFGAYPAVSLRLARQKREEAKEQLAHGIDPGAHKQATKAAIRAETENGFEVVAREWHAKQMGSWEPSTAKKIIRQLEKDIFPPIGGHGVASIGAPELLKVLQRIEDRGALDTAHRCRQYCDAIFMYAIATNRAQNNPAAVLKRALKPTKTKHLAAIVEPKEIGRLLRDIDDYNGRGEIVRLALRLAPYVFIRGGDIHKAEWKNFDLEKGEWRLPKNDKMQAPHIVPLCASAIAILKELHAYTGDGKYLFPSPLGKSRPITNVTLLKAIRRMGYDKETMSFHGFKSMASTCLNESGLFNRDAIERQLDHRERDDVRASYNYAEYLPERRRMMEWWGDYLDKLRAASL